MTASETFLALNADVPDERAAWLQHWSAWPDREVVAHPSYVGLFCSKGDRPRCLVQRSRSGGVLLPLIQRRLDALPWVAGERGLTDLVSPYGYGGAFHWGDVDPEGFWNAVEEWARRERAVSCFIRLSVIEDQVLETPWHVEHRASNVVRDLKLDADTLWMDYEHKVRKNVKRARRAGLEITVDATGEALESFASVYYQTMDRRSAPDGYYFPETFFSELVSGLSGQYCFFHCRRGQEIVSSELVLVSKSTMYSFLGGTLSTAFADRPNDLLKHHVVLWGSQQGKSRFVLGGGYGGDDGIFRYKRSFAPRGVVPFRTASGVLNREAYDTMCGLRRDWERRENGRSWKPTPAYFPAYRG